MIHFFFWRWGGDTSPTKAQGPRATPVSQASRFTARARDSATGAGVQALTRATPGYAGNQDPLNTKSVLLTPALSLGPTPSHKGCSWRGAWETPSRARNQTQGLVVSSSAPETFRQEWGVGPHPEVLRGPYALQGNWTRAGSVQGKNFTPELSLWSQ